MKVIQLEHIGLDNRLILTRTLKKIG